MDLNLLIKERARSIGIDLCGIADYSLDRDRIDWLKERKKLGLETEFEEGNLGLRLDPALTLENCSSIIVIAMSYNVESEKPASYKFKGRLSKSSYGLDYHQVLEAKMEELVESLKIDLDFNYRYFTDTGPLIDRELAQAAGLGYFGKNTSIINDSLGSFIFIGYILTDLDIQADKRLDKDCGSCDICLRACPTGAIEDYRLNPKKCLSYLSQTKETLSLDQIKKMGNRIYGCDTCQLVCPKNHMAKLSKNKEFIPSLTNGYMDIEELFKMTNREFKEKYGHMAGSWRGKNLLKRNALINLYNLQTKEAMDFIKGMENEESQLLKDYIDLFLKGV